MARADVEYRSIPRMALVNADRFGDDLAIIDGDLRLSFQDVRQRMLAVAAAHAHNRAKAVRYIVFTALGGVLFDILHLREWFHLFAEGYAPWKTPEGVPLFGAAFFGITGMHMTHVTIGVIYLLIIAFGYGKDKFSADDVEVSGLYWHFVDLVWMFVFPMIYLMSIKL